MNDTRVMELMQEVTDAMALLLSYCNVDEDTVHDAVAKSYRNVDPAEVSLESTTPFRLAHRNLFGRMLSYWRTLLAYVDESGAPRPLPAAGPEPSLETLYAEAAKNDTSDLSGVEPSEVAEILRKHNTVALDSDGNYVPISYSFKINTDTRQGAISNLAYLAEFASTAKHNAYKGQGGRFNAVARVQGMAVDQIPILKAMLYNQGYQFLTEVDAFLESKKSTGGDPATLRDIGVGVYLIDQPHKHHS